MADVLSIHEYTLSVLVDSGLPCMPVSTGGMPVLRFIPDSVIGWLRNGVIGPGEEKSYVDRLKSRFQKQFPEAIKNIQKINRQIAPRKQNKGYSLCKRKSLKYGFIYYVRYLDNGTIIPSQWSTKTNNKPAAEQFASDNRETILAKYYAKTRNRKNIFRILKNYYKKGSTYLEEEWNRGRRLSAHTAGAYHRFIIKKFIPFLRKRKITAFEEITPAIIAKLQNKLLKENKPQTVNYFIGSVKKMFDYLVIDGTLQENVISKTPSIPVTEDDKETTGCYTVDDVKGVFNRRWKDKRAYMLCILIYTTNLRNGEIERIKTQDVVRINDVHFIRVTESKTKNGLRIVPLHPFVYKKLRLYMSGKEGYIFFKNGKNNESVIYRDAYMLMGKMMGKTESDLEKDGISFYSGRTYWKTLTSSEGLGDIEEYFMGHKVSSDVAKRYNHRDKQGKAALLKKCRELFRIFDRRLFIKK
jgi:site-specific recombinase XerD